MNGARSLLNPGRRHLLAFIVLSAVLHLLWFVWYAPHGEAVFAPPEGGVLGMGGGDDIVFQLSRGNSGGPQAEILGSDLDLQEVLPESLSEDALEAPLIEDEAALPVAPADNSAIAAKQIAAAAKAAQNTGQAGKKQAGGDGGDADRTRRNRAGTGLSGSQMTSAFAGRTLHLTAGRLDIPGGNRLMNVKMHLFPDGTTRVDLVYFHYKTFHKLTTSTRHLKGDGKWWIEADAICFKAMVINYGATDCYEMNQTDNGELQLYFARCTNRSSSLCEPLRLGAHGRIAAGLD